MESLIGSKPEGTGSKRRNIKLGKEDFVDMGALFYYIGLNVLTRDPINYSAVLRSLTSLYEVEIPGCDERF